MKKIQGIIFIILIAAASVLIYFINGHNPAVINEIVTKKIVRGKDSIDIKKGNERIAVKTKNYNSKLKIVKTDSKDHLFTDSTDAYSLVVKVPSVIDPDLVSLDYLLNVKAREVMRTDTIYKIRTDTLNISTVKVVTRQDHFYNTFWFGSAITSLVILLILLIK